MASMYQQSAKLTLRAALATATATVGCLLCTAPLLAQTTTQNSGTTANGSTYSNTRTAGNG